MKVTRSRRSVDLSLPLDGLDMFLLSQLDMFSSTAEIAELSPCPADETIKRFERLAKYGLVELEREARKAPASSKSAPGLGAIEIYEAKLDRRSGDFEQRVTQRPKTAAAAATKRTQMGIGPVQLPPTTARSGEPSTNTSTAGSGARPLQPRDPEGRGTQPRTGAGSRSRPVGSAVAVDLMRTVPPPAGTDLADRSERASGVVEREELPVPEPTPQADDNRGRFARMTVVDPDMVERAARSTKA